MRTTTTIRSFERNSVPLKEAVASVDPFKQQFVGLRVAVLLDDGRVRTGEITRHECYDTDTSLCVERVTVRWDDGATECHGWRQWLGEAAGLLSEGHRPSYLRAQVI